MLNKKEIAIERYTLGDWIIEVEDCGNAWDAYLTKSECGVKSLMFGIIKEQPAMNRTITHDEMLDMVLANLSEYARMFEEEYLHE